MLQQGQWRLRNGEHRQGALFSCMDGVVCLSADLWMRFYYNLALCDVKSLAGPNEYFPAATAEGSKLRGVMFRARIAVVDHCSEVLGLLGHLGCLKHPGERDVQVRDIEQSLRIIAEWPFVREHGIILPGLWMVKPEESRFGFVSEAFELRSGTVSQIPSDAVEEVNVRVRQILDFIDRVREVPSEHLPHLGTPTPSGEPRRAASR